MGAYLNKESWGSPRHEPMACEDTSPPRDLVSRCQLPFDPRSPTDNIARTPIIVENASDRQVELDPRSPTVGIDRTPLAILLEKGALTEQNVKMETETDMQPPPLLMPTMDTTDAHIVTPPKGRLSSNLNNVDTPIPDTDVCPLLESAEQLKMNIPEPTPLQTKSATVPKTLFPVADPPSVRQAPAPRPPLGLVVRDTNSPRNIVQAKQRRQVTKSMGGMTGQQNVDKENIAH